MGWRTLSTFIATTLVVVSARADGEPGERERASVSLAESLSGPAREAFATAKLLFAAGDFEGALSKYAQAYEIAHDPRLVFNMAVAAQNLHDYVRARDLLVRYSTEAGDAVPAELRAQIRDTLATLETLYGPLALTVTPDGAAVWLDGQRLGVTPLPPSAVANVGRHRLKVEREGFVADERTIDVPGRAGVALTLRLTPEVRDARLVVSAPERATLVVDGKAVAGARYDAAVVAGAHKVHVSAPGYKAQDALLDIRARETRVVSISLEKEGLPTWAWVGGGVLVATGLALGGYFLFKPGDEKTPPTPGTWDSVDVARWRTAR